VRESAAIGLTVLRARRLRETRSHDLGELGFPEVTERPVVRSRRGAAMPDPQSCTGCCFPADLTRGWGGDLALSPPRWGHQLTPDS
jgi:hypothetical protein